MCAFFSPKLEQMRDFRAESRVERTTTTMRPYYISAR